MPLHEYRCLECDDEFETLVRPAEPAPSCPSCGSQRLDRVLSMFAVSSAEQSRRTLAAARNAYRTSRSRAEHRRHEGEIIREHLQEDYGVDVGRGTSDANAKPATAPLPSRSHKT